MPGRKATYLRIVAELRPLKAETKRGRFTAGGDQIDYPSNVSTPTANLTTVKLLINSVLSTPNARFATGDLGEFLHEQSNGAVRIHANSLQSPASSTQRPRSHQSMERNVWPTVSRHNSQQMSGQAPSKPRLYSCRQYSWALHARVLKESYRCEYTYYKGQGNKGCKEQKKKSTTQRIKTIGLRSSGEIRIVRVSPDDVTISGVIP